MNLPNRKWFVSFAAAVAIPSVLIFLFLFFVLRISLELTLIVSFICFAITFLIFNAFNREPNNIQSEVIIAFVALLLTGATVFFQKQDFELRNRPYIQVIPGHQLKQTGNFRVDDSKPQVEFESQYKFFNRGPIPGTVKDIIVFAAFDKNKLLENQGVLLGPNLINKEIQWEQLDVFPFLSDHPDLNKIDKTYYIGLNDVTRVFGLTLNEKELMSNAVQVKKDLFYSDYLNKLFQSTPRQFYSLIQIRYYAFDEVNNKNRRPYWYWKIYRHSDHFEEIASGTKRKVHRPEFLAQKMPTGASTMNLRELFALFYGVFFASMLSSCWGLRLFQWGWIFQKPWHRTRRLIVAVFFLNVAPALFFSWIYLTLPEKPLNITSPFWISFLIFLLGLSVFGFYRFYHLLISFEKIRKDLYDEEDLERKELKDRFTSMGRPFGQIISVCIYFLPVIVFLLIKTSLK